MIVRIAVRKPLLRPVNKQTRLQFAQEHVDWTIDQWQSVLWTDESKFELFGSHRRQYVRRKVNERFKPDCIVPTVKHGGGSVMVWNYEKRAVSQYSPTPCYTIWHQFNWPWIHFPTR